MSSKVNLEDPVSGDEEVDDFVLVEPKDLRSTSDLQTWLEPTDYLSPGNEYTKHINSHVPGTGDWLRSSEVFQNWKRPTHPDDATPKSSCLWIKGVPGSGKSVFSASTAKFLLDEGNIVLFFFFRQIVATNHDPKYLVRDWLAQLLPHSRWLHRQIDGQWRGGSSDGKDLAVLWDIFVQALRRMDRPVYCIADGLDEMDDAHAGFIAKLRDLGTDDQLGKVKMMLTSRPIPRTEEILRVRGIIGIKLDPTMLYPDIAHYVEVRLNTAEPKLNDTKYQEFKEAICGRAKGLFLHARLMTDNLTAGLRDGTIDEGTLPTSLERLPRNLKQLYTEMLAEHSRRSGITQEQQFMVLQCVVHSSRPLRLIELGSLVAMLREGTVISLKEGKSLVRRSCGCLLEILEDESVSVIHHSFTEFLRDARRQNGVGAFPILDKIKAHSMFVDISLRYLDKCIVPKNALWENWVDPDDDAEEPEQDDCDFYDDLDISDARRKEDERKRTTVQELRFKYPLLEYVITNLDHHVSKIDESDTSVFTTLDDLFRPGKSAFTLWLLMQWKSYRPARVASLHVASFLAWQVYAQHLILQGVLVDLKDAEGRTALSYAAEKGHADLTALLLQHGADPESDDRYGLKPLHYASQEGKLHVVEQLLAKGVSPVTEKTKTTPEWIYENFGSDAGETPLEYACTREHAEIVKVFLPFLDKMWKQKAFGWVKGVESIRAVLQTGEISINEVSEGRTRLYKAAASFTVDIVRVLLEHGADPNVRSYVKRNNTAGDSCRWNGWPNVDGKTYSDGATALHGWANYEYFATSYDSGGTALECFNLLVEAGGDIHAADKDGWTPLHCACLVKDHPFMGSWLQDAKDHLVKTLLEAGANPNAQTCDGSTPLHITNRPEVIDILVKHGADANIENNKGHTAFIAYLERGMEAKQSATFEKLLEISTRPDKQTRYGNTPLHGLMRCLPNLANPRLFEALIKTGLDVNIKNTEGQSPLLVVGKNHYGDNWQADEQSRKTYREIFRILKDAGMDMNSTDLSGRTILHILIGIPRRKLSTLEQFIEFGCDTRAKDHVGATMLHYVLKMSDTSLEDIDLFLKHGAVPLAVDQEGNTLMHELVRNSSYDSSRFIGKLTKLRELGVPTDERNRAGQTPFHLACTRPLDTRSAKELIGLFLDGDVMPRSDINAVDHKDARPIHYAAITSEALVKQLLDAGAEPEVLTNEGLSPLLLASRASQPNIVGLLLEEYRKRGVLDHFVRMKHSAWPHRTALHYACMCGRPESVRYLLAAGADPNALDLLGLSPLHVLAESAKGHSHVESDQELRSIPSTLSDPAGKFPPRPSFERHLDTERAVDIIELLSRAGARLDYVPPENSQPWEWSEKTPMDLAIENGCTEVVNELSKRGYAASETIRNTVSNIFSRNEEAELQQQVRESVGVRKTHEKNGAHDGQGITPPEPTTSRKERVKTIEKVLQLADYNMLREIISNNEEMRHEALHILAKRGYAILLEEFLYGMDNVEKQTPITKDDGNGGSDRIETLLGNACNSELPNLEVIKVLIDKGKVDINERFGYASEQSALHVLAEGRYFWHIEALDYLLAQGAEIDATVKEGMTPLMAATASSWGIWKDRTMTVLLKHGADPNKLDSKGQSALQFAEIVDAVRVLIKHGADLMLGNPPLLESATMNMRVDSLRAALEAGVNPNIRRYPYSYPLHTAAKRGNYHADEQLPQTYVKKKEQMIAALLQHGADPNIYDSRATVLQKVIEEHGIVKPLLSSAMIDLEKKGLEDGRTPLISSCYPTKSQFTSSWNDREKPASASPQVAMLLIDRGANVRAVDNEGRTALHWLCTLKTEFDDPSRTVFTALTQKAPGLIHHGDSEGWTPFSLAIKSGQTWATDRMLTLGIDPCLKDPDDNTALHYLAPKMFDKKDAAEEASRRFKHFLSLGLDINARNNRGQTPLLLFISHTIVPRQNSYGNYSIAKYKSDAFSSHIDYLSLFVNAGADLFTINDKGEGLLHITAARAFDKSCYDHDHDQEREISAIFKDLLAKGLDPRSEDGQYRTAIDVAVAKGHKEIVALFAEEKKGT